LHFRKTKSDSVLFDSLALCGGMNMPPLLNTCSTAALVVGIANDHTATSCILGKVDNCCCLNSKHDRCALVPCSHISRYLLNSPTSVGVVGVESDCVALYWSNSHGFFAGADQLLTKEPVQCKYKE